MTKLATKIKNLPKTPGSYQFLDKKERIIYVGKAINIKSRVGSYFHSKFDEGSKTQQLVENIADVQFIEVFSEFEALILEAALINKYNPKYNIALKDDKSYLYIVIRNEKISINGELCKVPRFILSRRRDLKKSDKYYGPFPSSYSASYILRTIRITFPFRDCSKAKFNRYMKLEQPCLYGHINLCSAPCINRQSLVDYKKEVTRIKKILSGDRPYLFNFLEKLMKEASKDQEYEKAKTYRDMLKKLSYTRKNFRSAQSYIDNPYLVEDVISKSLDELVKNIPILTKIPKRIECYDISNISGKEATGAMVVAIDGRIQKSEYRKFKIKLKDQPNDYAMLKEVLYRRILHEKTNSKKSWGIADLLVIDGGKGQVSATLEVLRENNVVIPTIGLAKKFETIVYCDREAFFEINLNRDNEGLKLLQRLRDEAHRFSKKYHHQLRLKMISEN